MSEATEPTDEELRAIHAAPLPDRAGKGFYSVEGLRAVFRAGAAQALEKAAKWNRRYLRDYDHDAVRNELLERAQAIKSEGVPQ